MNKKILGDIINLMSKSQLDNLADTLHGLKTDDDILKKSILEIMTMVEDTIMEIEMAEKNYEPLTHPDNK